MATLAVLVADIKRHSLEDGPGIRSVVFFKGCSYRCLFCHNPEMQSPRQEVVYRAGTCLGCGVCHPTCTTKSLTMQRREKRVLTPETTLERVISMSLGRGHLHDMLFDEQDGPTAAFLNRLTGAIENMPISKRLLVNQTLKSRFVQFLATQARKDKRNDVV